jgi:hypothetical protein
MRSILSVVVIAGCSFSACAAEPQPTGEDVFAALLANGDIELASEPLCQADIKLYQQLALSLSVSYESHNSTKIKSSCVPSKFEQGSTVTDIWDCTVQLVETDPKGEFISTSTYMFGLTRGKQHKLVKGSLRCF